MKSEYKKVLESDLHFQGLKKDIGLSFEDFNIFDLNINKHIKRVATKYTMFVDGLKVDSISFDTSSSKHRENRLNKLANRGLI